MSLWNLKSSLHDFIIVCIVFFIGLFLWLSFYLLILSKGGYFYRILSKLLLSFIWLQSCIYIVSRICTLKLILVTINWLFVLFRMCKQYLFYIGIIFLNSQSLVGSLNDLVILFICLWNTIRFHQFSTSIFANWLFIFVDMSINKFLKFILISWQFDLFCLNSFIKLRCKQRNINKLQLIIIYPVCINFILVKIVLQLFTFRFRLLVWQILLLRLRITWSSIQNRTYIFLWLGSSMLLHGKRVNFSSIMLIWIRHLLERCFIC